MTKIRVHELAKELGIENKELLNILKSKKIEVKSHMSSLEEEAVAAVRKEMERRLSEKESAKGITGRGTVKAVKEKETMKPEAEKAKTAAERPETEKPAAEKTEEAVPKKKNLVQVFRPQNAKNAGRIPANRQTGRVRFQGGRPGQRPVKPQAQQRKVPGMPPQRPVKLQESQSVQSSGPEETAASQRGQEQMRPVKQQERQEETVQTRPVGEQRESKPVRPGAEPRPGRVSREPRPAGSVEEGREPRPARSVEEGREQRPVRSVEEGREQRPAKSAEEGRGPRPAKSVEEGYEKRVSREGREIREQRGLREGREIREQRGLREGREIREQRGFREGREGREQRGFREGREGRDQRGIRGGREVREQRGFLDGTDSREQRGFREGREGREQRGFREGREGREQRFSREGGEGREQRFSRGGADVRYQQGDKDREYTGGRSQGRAGGRRDDRDSLSASIVEQQKSQRNKVKEKEKDYRKKELRDEEFENRGKKGRKGKTSAEIKKPQQKQAETEKIKEIILPEVLTIKELADKMKVVPSVIVKKLFLQGKVVTVNQEIDFETAEEIAMEFDILCEKEEVVDVIEELLKEEEEDVSSMEKRPPVVCVMGHVDHGKTSLLDAIRSTNVIEHEAGGITQHIGAYVVDVNGEKITFLDTPGHEAFTAMRMRGANATDIAILVVAADDGVMPQTVEAISHAKAAGVEIIVAVNKIDKPGANVERVKQELTEYELIPEDWGGSTVFVPVSARTKEGIQDLLEMILLTAEVLELKANADRSARGLVIEAQLDKGKGPVATVLVQKGTLRVGDSVAAGSAHGKVRAMMDDKGRRLREAGPSQPVEILGLNDVPNAGEVFVGCETEKEARNFAETFISQHKVKLLEDTKSRMSLDDLFTQIKEGNLKELNIVVKADVQGSVEALKQSLLKLSNDEVVIKIIHGGVGSINESDVNLASASNAIIIGFNVRPDATAKEIAEHEGVDLRLYRVIYNAIEDVEAAMKGMLDPVYEEKVIGHGEVRQLFKASGVGTIAGSYVKDGIFERNCSVRLLRDDAVIFDGALASLKRFKDDVKEVRAGYECGLVFENFNDVKEGDLVEAYKMVEVERK